MTNAADTLYLKAHVVEGIVKNVVVVSDAFTPTKGEYVTIGEYDSEGNLVESSLLRINGEVPSQEWVYSNGIFEKIEEVFSTRHLLRHLADIRYNKEVAGLETPDGRIATDRHSQSVLSSLYTIAKDRPDEMISFKGSEGFERVKASTLVAVADAVRAHVQLAYQAEHVVAQLIEKEEVRTKEAVTRAFNEAFYTKTEPV